VQNRHSGLRPDIGSHRRGTTTAVRLCGSIPDLGGLRCLFQKFRHSCRCHVGMGTWLDRSEEGTGTWVVQEQSKSIGAVSVDWGQGLLDRKCAFVGQGKVDCGLLRSSYSVPISVLLLVSYSLCILPDCSLCLMHPIRSHFFQVSACKISLSNVDHPPSITFSLHPLYIL
jgi:hypothetical protein